MRKLFFSLVATMLATVVLPIVGNAQVINGDLNHSGKLEVSDVTHLISNYLTGTSELINGGDPFTTNNNLVVGTWYKSETESITFNADGTTDYVDGYTYKFLPYQGCILFCNPIGIPVSLLRIAEVSSDYLAVLSPGCTELSVYSRAYVSLSRTELALTTGNSAKLTATATPVGTVTWISSNKDVATVSTDGTITAVGEGVAYITAESVGGKAFCTVTVSDKVFVSKITLSETSISLYVGDTCTLVATVEPSDASNQNLRWRTSNPSVVIPTTTGVIKCVSVGTAIITCSATDGSGVEASCKVSVADPYNGYEYVDLGLSVKWATMNLGATSPEDYGDYYAWGETTTKYIYSWNTYKWCRGSSSNMTKYCTDSSYGKVDDKTKLDLEDDVAHVNLGGRWRIPTFWELYELSIMCTWTWTTQNGVNGYKVTATNGNSIFLPAGGDYDSYSLKNVGSKGCYWSSSLGSSGGGYARFMDFYSESINIEWNTSRSRYLGENIRAVCP